MAVEKSSDPEHEEASQFEDNPDMLPTRTYVAPPRSGEGRSRSFRPSASSLPACAWICIIFIPLLWLVGTVESSRPFYHIFFAFLSLLPAFIVGRFVLTQFSDEAVSKSFLLSQFLLGAIPLSLMIVLVEMLLVVVFGVLLFSSDIQKYLDSAPNVEAISRIGLYAMKRTVNSSFHSSDDPISKDADVDKLMEALGEQLPLWKLLVGAAFFAVVVAGVTEEVGKWTLARRYRKVNSLQENVEWDRHIGCRGILAIACMGALGFATVENYGFVVGLTASPEATFQFGFVVMTLFRGLLAFPIHVGAQFYVAVAAAQSYIFHEPISVVWPLSVAILIHALFDGLSMVMLVLIPRLGAPSWTGVSVPILQSLLTVLLVLLCRGRYKALLERERMVLTAADPV